MSATHAWRDVTALSTAFTRFSVWTLLLTISLHALQVSHPSSTSYGSECSSSENSCGVSHCSCAAQLRTLLLSPSLLGLLLLSVLAGLLSSSLLLLLRRLPASLGLGRGLLPAA
jgi:hypothetical protein